MEKFNYGGQAVIEGVMMRGKRYSAIAVRKMTNEVVVRKDELKPWSDRFPILKKPIQRSCCLIETMVLGLQSLPIRPMNMLVKRKNNCLPRKSFSRLDLLFFDCWTICSVTSIYSPICAISY